jgi:hypothetical protein
MEADQPEISQPLSESHKITKQKEKVIDLFHRPRQTVPPARTFKKASFTNKMIIFSSLGSVFSLCALFLMTSNYFTVVESTAIQVSHHGCPKASL